MDLQSKLKGLLSRLNPDKKAQVVPEYESKIYSENVQKYVDKIGKQTGKLQNEIEELYEKRAKFRTEQKFHEAVKIGPLITKKHQMMEALQKDAEDLMNKDRKNL